MISITEVLMGALTGMIESLEPPRVISYHAYARFSNFFKKEISLKTRVHEFIVVFPSVLESLCVLLSNAFSTAENGELLQAFEQGGSCA